MVVENRLNNVLPNATGHRFAGLLTPLDVLDVASLGKDLVLDSNRKVLFNKLLAQKMLELDACPWERPLRDNHVAFLMGEAKRGTFMAELATLASCECKEDGREYRVNGQHTCWARTELDEKDWPPEPITVLRYKASTLNDLRRLYAGFDRGTPRTRANVLAAYLTGTNQFDGVSPTMQRSMVEGLAFWLWESGSERRRHAPDDLAYLVQTEHKELVSKVLAFCEADPKLISLNYMRRQGVIAAMCETFTKAVKPSEEFWHAVKVGIGFTSAGDPRLRLRNALMQSIVQGVASKPSKDVKIASAEMMYRWSILAWNLWRKGETVNALRLTKDRQRAK